MRCCHCQVVQNANAQISTTIIFQQSAHQHLRLPQYTVSQGGIVSQMWTCVWCHAVRPMWSPGGIFIQLNFPTRLLKQICWVREFQHYRSENANITLQRSYSSTRSGFEFQELCGDQKHSFIILLLTAWLAFTSHGVGYKTLGTISQHKQCQKYYLSSYCLVLMVIHFLQYAASPAALPCLHDWFSDKFSLLLSNDFWYVDMKETFTNRLIPKPSVNYFSIFWSITVFLITHNLLFRFVLVVYCQLMFADLLNHQKTISTNGKNSALKNPLT